MEKQDSNMKTNICLEYKEISFRIKSVNEIRTNLLKIRITVYISAIIIVGFFSIIGSLFNAFFFFLNSIKMIIFISCMFSLGYILIDDKTEMDKWNDKSIRKRKITSRVLHVLKETLVIFTITCAIFGLIHLSGFPKTYETNFLAENPDLEFPLSYRPSITELILILLIYILQFFACYTSILWLYSRTVQFVGFSEKKKTLQINLKRFLLGIVFMFIFWFVLCGATLDYLFIATKFPDILASWDKYDRVFTENAYLILVIELVVIVLLNAFYIIDGFLANKFRTNFVEMDITESL